MPYNNIKTVIKCAACGRKHRYTQEEMTKMKACLPEGQKLNVYCDTCGPGADAQAELNFAFTQTKHTHYLVVKSVVLEQCVIGASFWAPDNTAAGKIARAIVRTWVAATKKRAVGAITKDMVTLHAYK